MSTSHQKALDETETIFDETPDESLEQWRARIKGQRRRKIQVTHAQGFYADGKPRIAGKTKKQARESALQEAKEYRSMSPKQKYKSRMHAFRLSKREQGIK